MRGEGVTQKDNFAMKATRYVGTPFHHHVINSPHGFPSLGYLPPKIALYSLAFMLIVVTICGCGSRSSREEIPTVQEKTASAPSAPMSVPLSEAERLGINPTGGPGRRAMPANLADASASADNLSYETPQGWTPKPPSGMRTLDFAIEGMPEVECYFSVLPGGGGGLVPNVNRWRKQMGLPQLSEGEIQALPKKPLLGDQGTFLDVEGTFTGMGTTEHPGYRLLGLILVRDGMAYFAKMTGPAEQVAAQTDNFLRFCASLQMQNADTETAPTAPSADSASQRPLPEGHPPVPGRENLPADHPPIGNSDNLPAGHPDVSGVMPPQTPAGAVDVSKLHWSAPEGWQRAPERMMRVVTYTVGDCECYITTLSGAAGGIEANINRWRQQMGQPPLTPEEIKALPTITVLGEPVPFVTIEGTYTGMSGDALPNATMFGTVRAIEGQTLFVKMVGPTEQMKPQEQNFRAFCESLHLGD